jgi:hypothetical protein
LVKVVSSLLELVAGITSLNEHNPDSKFCADDTPFFGSTGGDNTAYLKVSNNLGWIQNTVGLTCARLSSSLFYRRCFQIPFIEDVAFEGLSRDAETAIAMAFL